ncbi:MAG: peptide chain release factor N(5)-glutamine methyltransferase [Almyronema sp.]
MPSISGRDLWVWWQQARQQAAETAVDAAEADWLLQAVCQVDKLSLRLASFKDIPQIESQRSLTELNQLWQKRLRDRVPVQYLVGEVPWRELTLQVSPAVLIPRPETELIVELAVERVKQSPISEQLRCGTWVDLGTGSGAIALALAIAFPQAQIIALDVSQPALAIAQQNAAGQGLGDRIQFLLGSWFEPLTAFKGQLAGIVSNPPYIPSQTIFTLEPEVSRHEPHLALDGGEDGLHCIRHLAATAPLYLQAGGLWLIEMMSGQGPAVLATLAAEQVYRLPQVHPDLTGTDRFVSAFYQPLTAPDPQASFTP